MDSAGQGLSCRTVQWLMPEASAGRFQQELTHGWRLESLRGIFLAGCELGPMSPRASARQLAGSWTSQGLAWLGAPKESFPVNKAEAAPPRLTQAWIAGSVISSAFHW